MKRFIALLLVVCMVCTAFPLQAKASQGGKLVALTFDDGPDAKDTPRLLDGLAQRGVKVTFFIQGVNAQNHTDILAREYNEGHQLANHSWNHPEMTGETNETIKSQIAQTDAVLDSVCGAGGKYLVRPPYGSTNDRVINAIGRPLICWSVDPQDWKYLNAYTVRDNIVGSAYDGSIILVHDIHSTTVDGALMAVDQLLAQGYEFVTVNELFRRRGVNLQDCVKYYACRANGVDLGAIPTPEITYTTDGSTMTVTIVSNSDAPVYYTVDGSAPNYASPVYTEPFNVPYPSSIQAVAAYDLNGSRSEMAKLIFGQTPCSAPSIVSENGKLVMSCDQPNANIYYIFNGTNPSVNGTVYTEPVSVPGDGTVCAVAGGGFYAISAQTSYYCSARGNLFTDCVPGTWYFDSVDRMVSAGIMNGMGGNAFEPGSRLNRAMLVTMLYRYCGDTLEAGWTRSYTFQDVPEGQWYTEAIEWAYRNQIINGYSDQVFNPGGYLTRQEMCKVINYFLTYRGHALPAGSSCAGVFADYSKIHAWALPSVEAMVSAGLIQGDGTNMNPLGTATRAEVAKILCGMMDYEAALGAK